MSPRLSKFGFPRPGSRVAETRAEIFEPTLGLDSGHAPQELRRGVTPESRNFIYQAGALRPRSGLSRYDATFSLDNDSVLGGFEGFDVFGNRYGLAASAKTFALLAPTALSWSTLSYIAATGVTAVDAPYASLTEPWDGTVAYDIGSDNNFAILTCGRQLPKFLPLIPSRTTFSDFTWISSLGSYARSVTFFDSRLVWFNITESAAAYPTRVLWSVRGEIANYTTNSGAATADLLDMRGVGTRIVNADDGLVLFSTEEIWRGRRRDDAYAFDFAPVIRQLGCPYPRTVVPTPFGVIFLAGDLEVYMLRGSDLIALGEGVPTAPEEEAPPSRTQPYIRRLGKNLETAFAYYNSRFRRYELYFTTNETSTNRLPQLGLWYSFDNRSWFIQRFPFELSHGFELRDTEEATTWDSISYQWNQYNVAWNNPNLNEPERRSGVWSSVGTPYRFHSNQTSDAGTAIDCRWRSHGLSQSDQLRFDRLYEVLMEYACGTASQVTVFTSDNLGRTFDSGFSTQLSASSQSATLAPVYVTAQSPVFEVRVADGSVPEFSRFQARLRDGGLYGGR